MSRLKTLAILAVSGISALFALRVVNRRRNRMDFRDKVVVITGGSRGLGLALAQGFAKEGARLALLARDQGDLQQAAQDLERYGVAVMQETCDVRDRYQVEQALGRVVRHFGRIDVLVNNAGAIQVEPVDHMGLEDFEDAMAVHFWGPLYNILSVRNYMRQQGGGRIVNITSIGGKVAVPHLAPYTASKFALVGLSDALRSELADENIQVTTVVPGLMRSGSYINAMFKGQKQDEYAWFSTLSSLPVTSTDVQSAAEQIIHACRYGDAELAITPQARLLVLASHIFPRLSAAAMRVFDRLLPEPGDDRRGYIPLPGYESQSQRSPSAITRLGDEAAEKYNELRGRPPLSEN